METILDALEQLGIFADLDPSNPDIIRQQFAQHMTNGELTFRTGTSGTLFAKFYNEPTEFRVRSGVFQYDPETGITHNMDFDN